MYIFTLRFIQSVAKNIQHMIGIDLALIREIRIYDKSVFFRDFESFLDVSEGNSISCISLYDTNYDARASGALTPSEENMSYPIFHIWSSKSLSTRKDTSFIRKFFDDLEGICVLIIDIIHRIESRQPFVSFLQFFLLRINH